MTWHDAKSSVLEVDQGQLPFLLPREQILSFSRSSHHSLICLPLDNRLDFIIHAFSLSSTKKSQSHSFSQALVITQEPIECCI